MKFGLLIEHDTRNIGDDVTEKVSGEVEGIENRFIKMINTIIDHIVTMFSI